MNGVLSAAVSTPAVAERRNLRMMAVQMWTRVWFHPVLVRAMAGFLPGTRRPSSSPGSFDVNAVRRILVGRMDGIGDMVLTLPLLAEIRRQFPSASITVATSPKNAELLQGSPFVDDIITIRHALRGISGRLARWQA